MLQSLELKLWRMKSCPFKVEGSRLPCKLRNFPYRHFHRGHRKSLHWIWKYSPDDLPCKVSWHYDIITLHNVCAVYRGIAVQRGISVYRGNILNTVGGGEVSWLHWGISWVLMISPQCTGHLPVYSMISPSVLNTPQCTQWFLPVYWISTGVLHRHYAGWLSAGVDSFFESADSITLKLNQFLPAKARFSCFARGIYWWISSMQ